MTTTTNFGLPIYGNSDKPKWTDTNEAFQDLDNKVADKTANNTFSGRNIFSDQVAHNADLLMKEGSTIESDDGVITPTAPSSDKTGTDVIQINDTAGNPLYKVRPIQHSNGKVDLDVAGQPAANGGKLTFNGEPVGDMHVYSTAEKVVGTWVDGRPIYEKIVEISNPTKQVEVALVTGANDVIDIKLLSKRQPEETYGIDTNFNNGSNDFLVQLKGINKATGIIWYYWNGSNNQWTIVTYVRAIVQYTKQ